MSDNTERYLLELEKALQLGLRDKADTIEYYREYCSDAGIKTYDEAVSRLGTPWQLASQIKADVAMGSINAHATKNERLTKNASSTGGSGQAGPNSGSKSWGTMHKSEAGEQKKTSTALIVGLVIAGILALPIGIPLLVGVLALLGGILICVCAVLFSLAVASLGIGIGGVFAIISSIILLPTSSIGAIYYFGGGLVCLGVSLLIGIGTYHLSKVTFKGIAYLFNTIRLSLMARAEQKQARQNIEAEKQFSAEQAS